MSPKPVYKHGAHRVPYERAACLDCRNGDHQACEDKQMMFCVCRYKLMPQHLEGLEEEEFF